MNELMNLRDKRVQTWNAAKAFLESHRGTDGTLSAEDDAIFNKMMDEVDKLGKEVMRLEKLEALDVEMSKATSKPLASAPVTRLDEEPVSKTGRGTKDYNTSFWKVMRNKSVPHEVLNALHVGTDTEGDERKKQQIGVPVGFPYAPNDLGRGGRTGAYHR